jgi:agmatine deiminase
MRLPAEWEEQSGVQLTWPHEKSDWKDDLELVEPVFVTIGVEVSKREKLLVVCANSAHVMGLLAQAGANMENVFALQLPSNDTWARDHGAITVDVNGVNMLNDFTFNGWGNKFEAGLDNKISRQLKDFGVFGDVPFKAVAMVLEGGGIESDGAGTLLTTSQCLLNPNRNPHWSQKKVETELTKTLGFDRFLWLHHGYLAGDDTDSHIDTLARFCDEETIAYVQCLDRTDEHYEELRAMEEELSRFTTRNNAPYRLIPLPMPKAKFDNDGERLPATYANFLIINDAVLVPVYSDDADTKALDYQRVLNNPFPQR